MSTSFKIRGIVVPLVTPFTKGGEQVDEGAIRAHAEWLIEKGVHGLMPNGSTGEAPLLSTAERKQTIKVVVNAARQRVPVIDHVGAITTRETIELAVNARAVGANAISVVTPYYFPYPLEALVEHFCKVADAVPDMPVFLYNIPSRALNLITRACVEEVIARSPNVVGIKDSTGDLAGLSSFVGLNQGKFMVTCGADQMIFKALQAGAVACVSGNCNAYPEVIVELFNAFWRGDIEAASRQQELMDRVRNLLRNGTNLALLKHGMEFRGISGGAVRPPMLEVDPALAASVDQELRKLPF